MGIDRWTKHPWLKNPWSKHRQAVWRERALDKAAPYPMWMRVGMLALGSHRANGRALYDAGELAGWLDISDLRNEIAKAKTFGWLDGESDAACLIVPSHAVEGGQ